MSDEQTRPILKAFFQARSVAPSDVPSGVAQVMARVPQTRQRGRWLPFPLFRRKAQRATATDTTAYEPRTIPATNGRALTVIGRTKTVLSPVKAITAGVLVFAIGGVFLIAQPFDPTGSVPGAEQAADPVPPVEVTITLSEGTGVEGEECTDATPPVCTWTTSREFSASDPRLSGTVTERVIERTWGGTGWIFEAYAIEVVNDEGAWVGTGRYVGGVLDLYVLTLTGEGAFEGLAAVVTNHRAADADEEGMKGVIIEGELPPFPELTAE